MVQSRWMLVLSMILQHMTFPVQLLLLLLLLLLLHLLC
jgi:hypothetical protein